MMGLHPRCYIPSFVEIGPLVLEKKIFAIYSHGGHLGHVTLIIYINFRSPFLRMLHMKFGFDWPSSFRGVEIFEIVNDGRRTDAGAWVYYKLTCEPAAQVS